MQSTPTSSFHTSSEVLNPRTRAINLRCASFSMQQKRNGGSARVFDLAHVPPCSHLQLIAAVLRGVPHSFFLFRSPISPNRVHVFCKPLTEMSQRGRCTSCLDGTAALQMQSLFSSHTTIVFSHSSLRLPFPPLSPHTPPGVSSFPLFDLIPV